MAIRLVNCFFLFGYSLIFFGQAISHKFIIKQSMTISNYHQNKTIHTESLVNCGLLCGHDPKCGAATMSELDMYCRLHYYTDSILYPLILQQSHDVRSLLRADTEFREVPSGYVYNETLRFWFKVVVSPMRSASDAKAGCNNDGAYLILIDSEEVFSFVKDTMVQNGLTALYFQGYRKSNKQPHVDEENNPLTFVAWQEGGAGSGSYVRMNSDYLMEATPGTPLRAYICQLHA